ncbi:acyltransferase [Vibrio cholerae]|uniref:acyltransferase n=1 Tax=Vibrio cholerae TaxID=666 RepID=UPI000E0C6651|nr:acyltransferase [Vibrio cholerae]TQP19626.1 acyltransferase [Vibrio cholerae]
MSYLLKKLWNKLRLLRLRSKIKEIGDNVVISHGYEIGDAQNLLIGSHVYIGPNASIWATGGIHIHNGVIIGPRVTIHSSNHDYLDSSFLPYGKGSLKKPVVIGRGVWIGDNVMICPGVNIAEGAVIAMGSVVTKNVEKFSIVGGNPAKVISYRDSEEFQECLDSSRFYMKEKLYDKK